MVDHDKEFIKARTVLWWMIFLGALVNFAFQISLNFAMVDMVYGLKNANSLPNIKGCTSENNTTNSSITKCSANVTQSANLKKMIKFSIERNILNWFNMKYDDDGFHWNEYIQNILLSSFLSALWLGGIPGGVICRRYGAKKCYGYATILSSILCFIIPLAAYIDFKCLIFVRAMQGFLFGLGQCLSIISFWVPPNERSQFLTAFLGASFSIFVCYPMFGYIIVMFSWEYVFYTCSIMGLIWCTAWQFLVFDTPALHPRISLAEKEYINKSLGNSVTTNTKLTIPWKSILTDFQCWSVVLADVGCIISLGALMTFSPTYFKAIHTFNLQSTGLVTGIPYLLKFVYAMLCSKLADHLIKTKKFSRNVVRKVATFSSNAIHGTFALAFAFSGKNAMLGIIFLVVSTTFHGSITAGPYASFVDISPNYSGILYGITTTFRTFATIGFYLFVGYTTFENQTMEQWRIVFNVSSSIAIITGLIYVISFDSNIRPWNTNQQLKLDITEGVDINNKKQNEDYDNVQITEAAPFISKRKLDYTKLDVN